MNSELVSSWIHVIIVIFFIPDPGNPSSDNIFRKSMTRRAFNSSNVFRGSSILKNFQINLKSSTNVDTYTFPLKILSKFVFRNKIKLFPFYFLQNVCFVYVLFGWVLWAVCNQAQLGRMGWSACNGWLSNTELHF